MMKKDRQRRDVILQLVSTMGRVVIEKNKSQFRSNQIGAKCKTFGLISRTKF